MSAVIEAKSKSDSLEQLKSYIEKDRWRLGHDFDKDFANKLYNFVVNDQVPEVEFLLNWDRFASLGSFKEKLNQNYNDPDKNTLLTLACRYASKEMVLLLLNKGADIHKENGNNYTPYLNAIFFNRKEIKACLEKYVSDSWFVKMNEKASNGRTAFMAAAAGGNVALMEEILTKDKLAYNQILDDGYTPLMAAIWSGSFDAMNFILKVDPESYRRNTYYGFSPLMCAIQKRLITVVEFILAKDTTVTRQRMARWWKDSFYDGLSPLAYAVKHNFVPAIECILRVDPGEMHYLVTHQDMSIVSFAAKHGSLEALKYLLSCGATMHYVTRGYYDEFGYAEKNNQWKVLEYLNQADEIFACAEQGDLSEIKAWKEAGNTLNLVDNDGDTLLHCALKFGQEEVAIYLMQQGVSRVRMNNPVRIRRKDYWETRSGLNPFQYAVREREWAHTGKPSPLAILKEMMKRVALSELDEKERAAMFKTLQGEYKELIQYIENYKKIDEKNDLYQVKLDKQALALAIKIDFEAEAINVDRKFWCDFAKKVIELQKSERNAGDYCAKYEKLSHLVYSGHVICKVNEKGNLIAFEPPKASVLSLKNIDTKEHVEVKEHIETEESVETNEERRVRLSFALKYAVEAEDFASGMRIALEMTIENPTLPTVSEAAQKALKIQSKEDFWIQFALLHYKPQKQIPVKEANPVTFQYQPTKTVSKEVLPLDAEEPSQPSSHSTI